VQVPPHIPQLYVQWVHWWSLRCCFIDHQCSIINTSTMEYPSTKSSLHSIGPSELCANSYPCKEHCLSSHGTAGTDGLPVPPQVHTIGTTLSTASTAPSLSKPEPDMLGACPDETLTLDCLLPSDETPALDCILFSDADYLVAATAIYAVLDVSFVPGLSTDDPIFVFGSCFDEDHHCPVPGWVKTLGSLAPASTPGSTALVPELDAIPDLVVPSTDSKICIPIPPEPPEPPFSGPLPVPMQLSLLCCVSHAVPPGMLPSQHVPWRGSTACMAPTPAPTDPQCLTICLGMHSNEIIFGTGCAPLKPLPWPVLLQPNLMSMVSPGLNSL
jgi:hypothetical protein